MIERELAMQLKEVNQKITNIMQVKFDEYGLTFGLLYLMMLIKKNPKASQKELAKQMRFTQGAMSISVKRLIKLNMVKQVQLETDARYNKLVITEKGQDMIDDYQDYLYKIIKDVFDDFSQEELLKLNDFIMRVNKNLEKINNKDSLINLTE